MQRIAAMPRWTRPGHALGRRRPRWLTAIGTIALLFAAVWLAARLDPLPPRFTGMAIAADGDSLRLGNDRVRLLGIDAPELDQTCWRAEGSEWPCGREARAELARLVAGREADCQPAGTDKYGRTLARCSVAGDDLGAAMVRAGLALATEGYVLEATAARTERRGLWQGRFVDPKTWRDEGPTGDPGKSLVEQLWDGFRELTGARALR
ncbi:MAG TPA: thermonuclease family protein [Devosia sp.]